MKTSWQKWVAFGDNHGWLGDRSAQDALVRFLDRWKPQHRIHVGDAFDFGALRRGISCNESQAYDDLEDDLLQGFSFLEKVRPTVLLLGNHDHRVFNTASNHANGVVRMAAREVCDRIKKTCKRYKTKLIPYHYDKGVYRLAAGRLGFVHGYTANMNSVGGHASHFGEGHGSAIIMGHLHRIEMQSGKRHSGTVGYSIGCLCDYAAMDYAAHRLATAQWKHGFAFGVVKGGAYQVWVAQKMGSQWVLPTGVEEL